MMALGRWRQWGSQARELLSLSRRGMSCGSEQEQAEEEEIGEASQVLRERYVGFYSVSATWEI